MKNERIKQLKHQASVWCDENIPEQFSEETNGYGSAWEEKFAELIVRECMAIARNREDELESANLLRESRAVGIVVYRMARQFGVEE